MGADMGTSYKVAQELCNTTLDEWQSKNFTNLRNCLMPMNYTNWLKLQISSWPASLLPFHCPSLP